MTEKAIINDAELERSALELQEFATSDFVVDPDKAKLADFAREIIRRADQEKVTADVLLRFAEDSMSRVRAELQPDAGLTWASDTAAAVLEDIAARREYHERTGETVTGIRTGFGALDEDLNGLQRGQLYLLAGGPGVGKTTTALTIAQHVAAKMPVVYVTFENSPANLTLKAICQRGGIEQGKAERGMIDTVKLESAREAWNPTGERLAIIEGHSALTVAAVGDYVREAMEQHGTDNAVLIIDYLQTWAGRIDARGEMNERVANLGASLAETAKRLKVPVITISSQSRAGGGYGGTVGKAGLDSLKYSGDLEYGADVVLILTEDTDAPMYNGEKALDLHVKKSKHGATGEHVLTFNPVLGTVTGKDAPIRYTGGDGRPPF